MFKVVDVSKHCLLGTGGMGGKGYGGERRGRVYTRRYTVTTRMTSITMGSDEGYFNVSLIVRDKVTRPSPQTTTFEEKGEPKRYRTGVLPLTSLTPYRWATPALIVIAAFFVCFESSCVSPYREGSGSTIARVVL